MLDHIHDLSVRERRPYVAFLSQTMTRVAAEALSGSSISAHEWTAARVYALLPPPPEPANVQGALLQLPGIDGAANEMPQVALRPKVNAAAIEHLCNFLEGGEAWQRHAFGQKLNCLSMPDPSLRRNVVSITNNPSAFDIMEHENQIVFFGKRGISCLAVMTAMNSEDPDTKMVHFHLLFSNGTTQDSYMVYPFSELLPNHIDEVHYRADNAGCYSVQ